MRTAGAKTPEIQLTAWTPTVPAAPAPEASTIKAPAANETTSSVDSLAELPQQTVKGESKPMSAAGETATRLSSTQTRSGSLPNASSAVRQAAPETELAVNLSRPLSRSSAKLPSDLEPATGGQQQIVQSTAAVSRESQAQALQAMLSPAQPTALSQQRAALPTPQTAASADPSSAAWQVAASPSSQPSSQPTFSFSEGSVEQDRSSSQKQSSPQKQSVQAAAPADLIRNALTSQQVPAQVPSGQQVKSADNDSGQPAAQPQRSPASGNLVQAEINSVLNNRAQAISLAPRAENEAFSLKMTQNGSSTPHTPESPQSAPPIRNDAPNNAKSDIRSTAVPAASNLSQSPLTAKAEVQAPAQTINPVWSESGVVPNMAPRPEIQFAEQPPSSPATATSNAREVAVLPAEAPRPSVSNEILLQLGGKDQPATVRVIDRAGTVNVSVHAADPDLRASLRSNLGDLASQLSHQGWKTEVAKTQTVLTQSNPSRDSSPDGQRDPGQQHSPAQGERQPQRDRRGNGGQWQAQFEESLSQNSSNSGGSN